MIQQRQSTLSNDHAPASQETKSIVGQRVGDTDHRASIDVRSLLNGAREATLLLDGEVYRLRITAKEKLILTK